MIRSHTSAGKRLFLTFLVFAVVPTACWDAAPSAVSPTSSRGTIAESTYDVVGDSNPSFCEAWNCRSLQPDEVAEMNDAIETGIRMAMQLGDLDCYYMFRAQQAKLAANQVYVARQRNFVPSGAEIIGEYNPSKPNEIYISESRFLTSRASRMDVFSHEVGHHLGLLPESDAQSLANQCAPLSLY